MQGDPVDPPSSDTPDPGNPGVPHRRRTRYRGSHPRRFEERYKERDPKRFPEMAEHVRAQGRTPAGTHLSVLVEEVLDAMTLSPGDVVADLTLGYGGHAREILSRIGPTGRLVALDHDETTLRATQARLEADRTPARSTFHAVHFGALPDVLASEGLAGCDAVLADLGVSSMQIDDPGRGFSFRHDGPLDMRMDSRRARTAATVLATISEADLEAALQRYADEPDAERIAKAIAAARDAAPIETTSRLAEVVLAARGLTLDAWKQHVRRSPDEPHPAARTFQALRILVNEEMSGLERLLSVLPWCLRPGGRAAVISFHSGEDRRVKHAFREGLESGLYEEISDRVIRASPAEIGSNPRAAPAKLRWARRNRAS